MHPQSLSTVVWLTYSRYDQGLHATYLEETERRQGVNFGVSGLPAHASTAAAITRPRLQLRPTLRSTAKSRVTRGQHKNAHRHATDGV